jgi:hypothetical protein
MSTTWMLVTPEGTTNSCSALIHEKVISTGSAASAGVAARLPDRSTARTMPTPSRLVVWFMSNLLLS